MNLPNSQELTSGILDFRPFEFVSDFGFGEFELEPAGAEGRRVSSAGFLTCRIADFPVGWVPESKRASKLSLRLAGWKTRETADWKVCATNSMAAG